MAHQRQLIREAARAQLLGKTAAGARVAETRMSPWRRPELPAISVYSLEEAVDAGSKLTAPRELTRNLQLAVVAGVEGGANVDDAMDSIAEEIERALHADPYLGDTCGDLVLASTELGIDEDGTRPIGYVRLTFAVTYRTWAPDAADATLPADFATAHIETSLGGTAAPADRAVDDVAVPIT